MSDAVNDLRDLYQDLILDHGRNPRNRRRPVHVTHQALGHNPMCGDKITVYVTRDESGTLKDVAFDGQGCAISTASASMMTEIVRGKSEQEAEALFSHFHHACTQEHVEAPKDLDEDDAARLHALSGVRQFPVRVKCATLAWHALHAALSGKSGGAIRTEDGGDS